MVMINLELWKNPNFPLLDILENQTNEVLEAFNKCRKLELELQGNDTEIKKFNISINTLTERRAQESYKHSSYSKNVAIYMDALSKESETIETILIILSPLLSEAEDRRESTNQLKQDYQDFFESFNNYYVIDDEQINSNNQQIEIKNPEFAIPILSFFFSTFIFYLNMNCDPLSSNQDNACNNIPEILWRALGHPGRNASKDKKPVNDEKEQKDEETQKDGESQKDEKIQNGEKTQKDEKTQSGKKTQKDEDTQKDENTQKDEDSQKDENTQKDGKSQKDGGSQTQNGEKTQKDEITTWCPSWISWVCNSNAPLSKPVSINDTKNQVSGFSLSNQMIQNHTNDINDQISEFNQTGQIHVSQYMNAIVFGILIALLMWILLRITKPMNTDRRRRSQKRLEELSQQNNDKILEIKRKLPVIITNVDILCQFWDNQVHYIKTNSDTLSLVDEKEKIKIPKELALSIKEDWGNQSNSCEKNYARMRQLVTLNFILTE